MSHRITEPQQPRPRLFKGFFGHYWSCPACHEVSRDPKGSEAAARFEYSLHLHFAHSAEIR